MGGMKVAICAYRNWAVIASYRGIAMSKYEHETCVITEPGELMLTIKRFEPDVALFYGWSWLVPKDIVNNYYCICMHPSRLPRWRGGSPLQNQIIAGETTSSVTFFHMGEGLDDGPILAQYPLSLEGDLDKIFSDMTAIGTVFTKSLLNDLADDKSVGETSQDESLATVGKRRNPEDSEITVEEIASHSAEYVYNKIRALYSRTEDYPPAYIKCGDGKKVYLQEAKL